MVNNWHRNARIEFKCDVFFKMFKLREFRNSLVSAGDRHIKMYASPAKRDGIVSLRDSQTFCGAKTFVSSLTGLAIVHQTYPGSDEPGYDCGALRAFGRNRASG